MNIIKLISRIRTHPLHLPVGPPYATNSAAPAASARGFFPGGSLTPAETASISYPYPLAWAPRARLTCRCAATNNIQPRDHLTAALHARVVEVGGWTDGATVG